MIGSVWTDILAGIIGVGITMVAGLYHVVSGAYQIFLILAKTNIFGQETYVQLTDKVYIILAVTMLFVVAYTFITMIIDPDKNKGGKAVEDLIKKSITSLILIVICPTLFTLAFDLQDAIMDQDIIGKFFTAEGKAEEAKETVKQGGNLMAGTTFAAFFYPALDGVDPGNIKNKSEGISDTGTYQINCAKVGGCTLENAIDYASNTGKFKVFKAFKLNIAEDDDQSVEFGFLMSLIAGGYLIIVIVSFCFDLAIRVVKLAFYQIIAPICIACRMLPNKESIFKNWWKAVSKTYLSVFIRVFIMNLGVFLMTELVKTDIWNEICTDADECGGFVKFLAWAFIILGLVTFIKQASKLIDEIFGLGDVKLGLGQKLKESGAFTAGAAIGAGVGGLIHGGNRGIANFKNSLKKNQGKNRLARAALGIGAGFGALGTTVGRGLGAATRAASKSTNSFGMAGIMQDYKRMKDNAAGGLEDADFKYLDRKDKQSMIKESIGEIGTYRTLTKGLKDATKRLREMENQTAYLKYKEAKIEFEKLTAATENLNNTIKNNNAKIEEIKKNGTISEAEKQAQIARLEAENKAKNKELEKLPDLSTIEKGVEELKKAFEKEKNMTIEDYEKEIKIAQNDVKLNQSQLQEFLESTRFGTEREKILTQVKQFVTGVDQSKAQDLVINYNDEIKKATEKVINKYSSKITVDFSGAAGKNNLLKGASETICEEFQYKTVQDINAIASQLSIAQDMHAVKAVLGEDISKAVGLNETNFAQIKEAFIQTIREPYQKDVNKYVTDAVTVGNGEYEAKGADGQMVKLKITEDVEDLKTILGDLDTKSVGRKKYAYDVLYYELTGETDTAPKTAEQRKKIEDTLREQNAANDRIKAGAKVMKDVHSTVSSKSNNN